MYGLVRSFCNVIDLQGIALPTYQTYAIISIAKHLNYVSGLLSRPFVAGYLLIDTQGRPIDQDEIYRYTNGRFLVDEKIRCDRRYVKFDFDRLCELASSVGESKCRISSVKKIEGGFSKALRMAKEDGTEVIAKIPCPNAGPASSTTASEVAVMKYGRCHSFGPFSRLIWVDVGLTVI